MGPFLRRRPGARPAGARRVLAGKGRGIVEAGLVAQGCQENRSRILADAPTGSRDALRITPAIAAQTGCGHGWIYPDPGGTLLGK